MRLGGVVGAGTAALAACASLALGGCTADPPATAPPPTAIGAQADREQLAGFAAAAKDKRYVATYTLSVAKQPDRIVTVAVGADGSWVVAIPAGALSGLADVAVFGSAADSARYQCLLGPAAGTAGRRPDLGPLTPGCVKVTSLTTRTDPRVQHVFVDWIDPLMSRATALSVNATTTPVGAVGTCFSVESNSAALTPPVDPGVYCYRADGILTAAEVGFGSLVLAGPVDPAPPSVALPAPVVSRAPIAMTAPPEPTVTATSTPTPRPT